VFRLGKDKNKDPRQLSGHTNHINLKSLDASRYLEVGMLKVARMVVLWTGKEEREGGGFACCCCRWPSRDLHFHACIFPSLHATTTTSTTTTHNPPASRTPFLLLSHDVRSRPAAAAQKHGALWHIKSSLDDDDDDASTAPSLLHFDQHHHKRPGLCPARHH